VQSATLPVEALYSNNAVNQAPVATAVPLTFRYSLAKITLTVTANESSPLTPADFDGMTVAIEGMYTQAKLKLADGAFTDRQDRQTIMMHRTGGTASSATFSALVLPADEEAVFVFNAGGNTFRYPLTRTYAAHTGYTFGFRLNFPDIVAVLLSSNILPRDEEEPENFEVSTKQMTMTTAKEGEVSFELRGTGTASVSWGDGTPGRTYTLWSSSTTCSHTYSDATARTITITGNNVTYLFCNDNQITALDVSKNTALTTLYCGTNQLSSLDVSKNTALTYLNFSNNQLSTLDVSKNTALTSLWCSNNQLSALDLSKNTAMETLSCFSNPLSTLDVSKNTALTYLACTNNQLSALDVSKNTALVTLYCNNNQLSALDVSQNTALTNLQCYINPLSALDVSQNTALITLYCYFNQLSALDVSKNTALTALRCQSNQFDVAALNALFGTLHDNAGSKTISIANNPGTSTCDQTIATAKGWTVNTTTLN